MRRIVFGLIAALVIAPSALAQSPALVVTSAAPEGGADIVQVNASTQGSNGPVLRMNAVGDLFMNHSLRITGNSLTGGPPGSLPYMFYIQNDLGVGMPTMILQANISADMNQPFISGYGNNVERFRVDSFGAQWLRGPLAGLEISRSGGSGPLVNTFKGAPTTTGDNGLIVGNDFVSNTGDTVASLQVVSRIDNSGGEWLLRAKQPSGAMADVFRASTYGVIMPSLAGAGSTHVCADAAGKLFRCP